MRQLVAKSFKSNQQHRTQCLFDDAKIKFILKCKATSFSGDFLGDIFFYDNCFANSNVNFNGEIQLPYSC